MSIFGLCVLSLPLPWVSTFVNKQQAVTRIKPMLNRAREEDNHDKTRAPIDVGIYPLFLPIFGAGR